MMGSLEEVDLRWMDYVKDDMRIRRVNIEMKTDEREMEENGRRKHVVPTPLSGIRG
jgi:hypothetical protein